MGIFPLCSRQGPRHQRTWRRKGREVPLGRWVPAGGGRFRASEPGSKAVWPTNPQQNLQSRDARAVTKGYYILTGKRSPQVKGGHTASQPGARSPCSRHWHAFRHCQQWPCVFPNPAGKCRPLCTGRKQPPRPSPSHLRALTPSAGTRHRYPQGDAPAPGSCHKHSGSRPPGRDRGGAHTPPCLQSHSASVTWEPPPESPTGTTECTGTLAAPGALVGLPWSPGSVRAAGSPSMPFLTWS